MSNNIHLTHNNIDEIINHLSLQQKAQIVVGVNDKYLTTNYVVQGAAGYTFAIDSLGIPSISLADGPVGVRITPEPTNAVYTSYATCFPSTTALAATWNKELSKMEGEAIGNEAKAYGVDVMLTPGINIMRNPLCGRNFEYYSEDPYLSGFMAANMITGIQNNGVGTSLKHFVANNQQTGKLYNDARIPLRALRELYLKGFEICIKKSNPWTVMGSYNKIGGTYTQTNPELMKTILRDEWGYQGLVITDWYKTRNTVEQINAGSYLLMPGEKQQIEDIINGVNEGKISMETLNKAVKNVLELIIKTPTFNGWKYTKSPDLKANAELAKNIAIESMVLLKNDSNILPIRKACKVALFGATAYKSIAGGTGSSNVNKAYIINVSEGLESAGYSLDADLKRIYGKYIDFKTDLQNKYPNSKKWEQLSYYRTIVPEMGLKKGENWIAEASSNSDIAIIVLGRDSGEESDRRLEGGFNLTSDEKYMINQVTDDFHKKGKKVIVVMNVCGVVETASWKDKPDAILLAWLPGQECGNAIAEIINGKAYPSGHLPMTFPINYSDIPSSKNYPFLDQKSGKNFDYTNYEEGIWVGYRYFNTADVKVSYSFGYGLGYTSFSFSEPKIKKVKNDYIASIKVTNIGVNKGKECVQLYIKSPNKSMIMPESELKAFGKTKELSPGESAIIELSFNDYDLASFEENISSWKTSKGRYEIWFGNSSTNILAKKSLEISTDKFWKVNDVLKPVEKVNELIINLQ